MGDIETKEAITSSPYYLSNNDQPHHVITPFSLDGDNYEKWAKIAKNNLSAKSKLGFVDGTLLKPAEDSSDYARWIKTNSMLCGWLYASLDPKVQKVVSFVDNARTMWENLRIRYSIGNTSRVHQIKASIAACSQDGQTIADYFGKLKIMWDDLDDFEPSIDCCCSSATCPQRLKQQRRRDLERIHQFLMGLDASRFATTRTTILSRLNRDTDMSLDQIYSELIAEERHLIVAQSKEERLDAVGFAVKTGTHGLPEWWIEKHGDSRGSTRSDSTRSRGRGSHRGRGRGRSSSSYRANNAQVSPFDDSAHDLPGVSKETWFAIVNLLKTDQSQNHEKLSGKKSSVEFLLDSGASHHMTGDEELLVEIQDIPRSIIVLPNGKHTFATKEGTMLLGENIRLNRVLFVPDLSCTLISLARLLRDMSCFALFTDKVCVLQDRTTKMLIGAGEERDGVYHFKGAVSASASHVRKSTKTLWHERLGHPSPKVLSSFLSKLPVFDSSSSGSHDFCEVCIQAKQTRSVFPDSNNKAEDLFSLIHCDVWGPYKHPSTCGARYFLTIVDDYSRAVWTILLVAKSEVAIQLKRFISMASTQFNKQVKIVRSDNGTEFLSLRSFFRDHGIAHQTSCVYTPQQNGRVERKHRHLLNVARSLLFQSDLSIKFWGESVLTAAYLINRTPTPLLDGKTPYEMLHSTPPVSAHLRVFGCLCYAKRLSGDTDKFKEKGRRCIFVGYPHNQKGWRVYDIEKDDFFVSRDVVFKEDEFPFSSTPQALTPPLPEHVTFGDDDEFENEFENTPAPTTELATPPDLDTNSGNLPITDRGSSSLAPSPLLTIPDVTTSVSTDPLATTTTTTPEDALFDLGTEPLGRGLRQKKPSVRLQGYVANSAQLDKTLVSLKPLSSSASSGTSFYPISDYVSCDKFSTAHQKFLAAVTLVDEPVTYKQAVQILEWREAMSKEIEALELNETWTLEKLPHGVKALGSKWVFRLKFNSDGTLERYKARLVALGNHQKEGVDFDETFAPVAKMQTVRVLLGVASIKHWELHQMDVHNAFLHGDLDEDIYMKPPPGFLPSDPSLVCKLKKSIYGLRQAPRCWFSKLSSALTDYGFVRSHKDNSLFAYTRGSVVLHVLVYVDDLIVCGNDSAVITSFKAYLSRCFKMKDLGVLKYFLGLEVARGKDGIFLSQRKYCLDIIEECGLSGSRPVYSPLEQNHKLLSSTSPSFSEPDKYRRLIGRLVYLTHTRPEISYAVNVLAQFMQNPLQDHWEAAIRLVRYLKSSPGQGIVLSSSSPLQVNAFCDSDYNSCPNSRRSLTGYMIMIGDSPVTWKTKKQSRVSLSSAEAEYRAMAMTCKELLWLKEILEFLGVHHSTSMQLYCDSKAALHIAANPVFHERTKHIESDCHFVRDEVTSGNIATAYISTHDQPADIFTKALGRDQFQYLRSKLGVLDLHAPT
ncbi:GAG-pre-integrase domain [Arabidopsis thaliana x Arabidopsis arenosa]|uniref:GAG-pre-integrase domain n=1 Tax=Arabidopsis thaliana x Arabidopsis arenosa TaxID=1240361 RepID=A0A8T2C7D4_9BRAS|nr:GAG-pre-integrase domain [Arabidopsis thaliana x Arabidopsis arenosa]